MDDFLKQFYPNAQPTQSMAGSNGISVANNNPIQSIPALNAKSNANAQGAAPNQFMASVRPQDQLSPIPPSAPKQTGITAAANTLNQNNTPDVNAFAKQNFANTYNYQYKPQGFDAVVDALGSTPGQYAGRGNPVDLAHATNYINTQAQWADEHPIGSRVDSIVDAFNTYGGVAKSLWDNTFGGNKSPLPAPVNPQGQTQPTVAPIIPNGASLPTYGQFDPIKFQGRAIDNAMAQRYTGGDLNLPANQFNRNNLQNNYQNALNAPGTNIDTSTYNQMNQGYMGQNAQDIANMNDTKAKLAQTIAQLEGNMSQNKETLGTTMDWSKLFSAAGDIKLDKSKRDKLLELQSQLTTQDNSLNQQQRSKLIEDSLNTERLRAFKQPEFAQDLAKTNLNAQNNVDLNMQNYDQRMSEIGVNQQGKNIDSQRAYLQDLAKARVGLVSPTNVAQAYQVSNEMRNAALAHQALFDKDPAKKLAAVQELYNNRSLSAKPDKPDYQGIANKDDGSISVLNKNTGEITEKLTSAGKQKRVDTLTANLKANVNPLTGKAYTDAERNAVLAEINKLTS